MKQLIYDVRALRKVRRVVAPEPVSAPVVVDEAPDKRVDPLPEDLPTNEKVLIGEPIAIYFEDEDQSTEAEKAVRRMEKKNPALTALIGALDLTPIGVAEPDSHKRCRKLAEELLSPGLVYTKDQLLDLISTKTKGDKLRAEAGFALMLTARAIERTLNPDLYYLGSSTPF
ncbi:hypothetical protein [Larkinella harenae]